MKKLTTGIGVLIVLVLLAATVGTIVYGVIEDPAVVGPLAAAAVAISVAVYQRRWEKKQELERLHRAEMSPIYERLIEVVKSLPEFAELPESEQQAFFKDTSSRCCSTVRAPCSKHGSRGTKRSRYALSRCR